MTNVIVTGAGKGLGKAIARQLLDDGLRVLAVDREGELLSSLAAEFGNGIECCQIDVTDHEAVERFFRARADQPLHGLVNNAGILLGKNLLETDLFASIPADVIQRYRDAELVKKPSAF